MADLVNDTAKRQLSPKNSEPSHLKGGSYDVLGGPDADNKGGADSYKIDAAKGVGTDSSIPRATGPEKSHLPAAQEDLDVKFDDEVDEDVDVDELDKELDAFEDVDPVDVDIEVSDEDDVREEAEKDDDEVVKEEVDEDEKSKEQVDEDDDKDADDKDQIDEDDEKDEADKVEESVKVRIKMPSAKLFESANMSAKTQKKVGVVFEQAIRETTKQVASQLHAHYKKLHEQRLRQRDAAMAKQMDAYLSYVTEEWMKANRPVVRQSLRAQLAEEFLDGLQRLFKEHYIDVPASRVNVVEKLTVQNAKLKKALNEQHAQKLKLRRLAETANKARIVAEFARGMSTVSAAKLHKLAEDTSYSSAKDFREKLSMLKESYFPKDAPVVKTLPEETVQDEVTSKSNKSIDPDVNAIADVLSRQSKSAKW